MFYVYDFMRGAYVDVFNDEYETAYYGQRYFGCDFVDLNITGKDITVWTDYRTLQSEWRLRRYMIVDEHGRHIDVRNWPIKVLCYKPQKIYKRYCVDRKSKQHRRGGNHPSMWRGSRRSMEDDGGLIECKYGIILNHSSVRTKAVMRKGDYLDKVKWHHIKSQYMSKCWKDQGRSQHQYKR